MLASNGAAVEGGTGVDVLHNREVQSLSNGC